MERRFNAKDFTLLSVLGGLFAVLLLTLYQIDRQWRKMDEINTAAQEQAQELREIRTTVDKLEQRLTGGTLTLATGATPSTGTNPAFRRAADARQQTDFAEGDWVVNAMPVNIQTITPLVSKDAYASDVQSYVLESLLTRDPVSLDWQGMIARDWQISPDGLVITFNLRTDVRFSDGQPLTAHDVAFSFDFAMNPAIDAPDERAYFEKLASVKAVSDNQVVFTFKEPYFNALQLAGGMSILPKHFYMPMLNEPAKFNQSKGLLLGSGPFRLKDPQTWAPDAGFVELERNPRYWGEVLPPYARIVWKVIANETARLASFRNSEIDSYSARAVEYKKLVSDDDLSDHANHWEYMSPVAGYSYIGWNQLRGGKPTRFTDRRVRLAMTLLANRERVVKEIFLGYAEIAVSPFCARCKQHDANLTPHPFDVNRARDLLKEAGYHDRNNDGILDDSKGKSFEFELMFNQDREDTKRMVLLLKDLYAQAGVLLKPMPTEWAVMVERLKKQDFEAITLGWTSGIETDLYQMFHSSQTTANASNFISYKNPELDKLIEQARQTVDEPTRLRLWQAAEKILHEDQPYTFLLRSKSLLFIDKRIKNISMTSLGLNFGALPIETYVPTAQQRYKP